MVGFIQFHDDTRETYGTRERHMEHLELAQKTQQRLQNEAIYSITNPKASKISSASALSQPHSGRSARRSTTKSGLDPIAKSGSVEDDGSFWGHPRWEFKSPPSQRNRRIRAMPTRALGNIKAPQTGLVESALPAGSFLSWRHTKSKDKARLEKLRSNLQKAAGKDLLSKSGCARYTRKLDLASGKWSKQLDSQVKVACEQHLLSTLENANNPVLAEGRCEWNDEYKYCDFETKEEGAAREAAEEVARQKAAEHDSIRPLMEPMEKDQKERRAREAAKSRWLGVFFGGNRGTRRSKNKRRSRRKQTHSKAKSRSRRRIRRRRTKRSVPAIQK